MKNKKDIRHIGKCRAADKSAERKNAGAYFV